MPKVRPSSGTMGTTREPMFLSRIKSWRICTSAMVVEISRSSVERRSRSKAARDGTTSDSERRRRLGRSPPSSRRRAFMYSCSSIRPGTG